MSTSTPVTFTAQPGAGTETMQLRQLYGVSDEELSLVQQAAIATVPRMDHYVDSFYRWLRTQPEYAVFFGDDERLGRVKGLQRRYFQTFFAGVVDDQYVATRRRVGEVHARIGLGLPAYFAAMDISQRLWADDILASAGSLRDHVASERAVTRLMHLDTALVVQAYTELNNTRIAEQTQALLGMSTPVTSVWEDILLLPVVGIVDSRRAQDIMTSALTRIGETRAKVFILDIGGVSVVDTAVANHLFKVTRATRLMGCECLLSGLSPAIAQTMVELGIDVGAIKTRATLRDALEEAFRWVGVEVRRVKSAT
jgi:rsbT co-antagonist protein RsbR